MAQQWSYAENNDERVQKHDAHTFTSDSIYHGDEWSLDLVIRNYSARDGQLLFTQK